MAGLDVLSDADLDRVARGLPPLALAEQESTRVASGLGALSDADLRRVAAGQPPLREAQPTEEPGTLSKVFDFLADTPVPLTRRVKRDSELTPEELERRRKGAGPGREFFTEGLTPARVGRTILNIPKDVSGLTTAILGRPEQHEGGPKVGLLGGQEIVGGVTRDVGVFEGIGRTSDAAKRLIGLGPGQQPGGPLVEAGAAAAGELLGFEPEKISPEAGAVREIVGGAAEMVGGIAQGDLEPIFRRVEEFPVQSGIDLATGLLPFKGIPVVQTLRTAVNPLAQVKGLTKGATKVAGGATEQFLGGTTGIHAKPLRIERQAQRAAVADARSLEELKDAVLRKPEIKGFSDIVIDADSIPDLARRLVETVDLISDEAGRAWKAAFKELKMKPGKEAIDFAKIREDMVRVLADKHHIGIDPEAFAQGRTVLDFSDAGKLKNATKDQEVIREFVKKMDDMHRDFSGRKFKGAFREPGVVVEVLDEGGSRVARRETYTGEDLHDTLVDFRSTQIDKMGTVKSPDADDIVNTLVGSYDTELRSKLVGFGDLQDARKAAFDLTNTIKKDFSIKPRKDASGFVLAPDQRINMGTQSRLEQALSGKQTKATQQQTLDAINKATGIDFKQAIARLRTSTASTQGIARATPFATGSIYSGMGMMYGQGPEALAYGVLAGIIENMTLGNPRAAGAFMRVAGATQGVADQFVRKFTELGKLYPNAAPDALDLITVGAALQRQRQEGLLPDDILENVGSIPR